MRLPSNGRSCHPKIRPSSLRHYALAEPTVSSATDLVRGKALALVAGGALPAVVPSCTARGRRFFSTRTDSLAEAASDAELAAVLLEEWTIGVLFRVHTLPFAQGILFDHEGIADDVDAARNALAFLRLETNGQLTGFWENGVGTNVTSFFTDYTVKPYVWTYAVLRKRDVTAVGPGGTCALDLMINGATVQTFTGIANASDGAGGVLRLGHQLLAGPTVGQNASVDFAGLYVWGEALSDDDVAQDARRIRQLPFFTRTDLTVRVVDRAAAHVELSNLDGVDFVDEVEITNEIDQATMTARVSLFREQERLSLAGLVTSAKANLSDVLDPTSYEAGLYEGQEIEVLAARVPLGLRASLGDFQSLFLGNIDEIEEGEEKIALACRDSGGILIDTYIEEEVDYGSSVGVDVETAMQNIVDDNDDDTGNNSVSGLTARTGSYAPITLDTQVSPGWLVKDWRQRREPVLSALRALAGQTAWDCRYRYSPNPFSPGWRLSFYEPERTRLDVDTVLEPDEILDVSTLKRSIFGRRQVVRVIYPSSETTLPTIPTLPAGYSARRGWYNVDGEGNRMVAFIEITCDTAVAALGRRLFMEVVEDAATQIDTITEAFAFALGMCRDLQDAGFGKSVRVAAMWEAELNDMLRFKSNPILFTADQTMAIQRITHSFGDVATTTLELRGKPAVGFKRWLRLEARPGNGRPGVMDPTQALTGTIDGELLKLYRNVVDRSAYMKGGRFTHLLNGEFQSFSAGQENPPDGWEMRGTWGTDMFRSDASQISGGYSIEMLSQEGQTNPGLVSKRIPVDGDSHTPYSAEITWMKTAADGATPVVKVEWYTAADVLISSTSLTVVPFVSFPNFRDVTNTADVWFTSRADGIIPPSSGDARFARVVVRHDFNAAGAEHDPIRVDRVGFYRTARELVTINDYTAGGTNYAPPGAAVNDWVAMRWNAPAYPSSSLKKYDWAHNAFDSGTAPDGATTIPATGESLGTGFGSGWYAREDMTVGLRATVTVGNTTAGTARAVQLRIVKNATYNANHVNTGGTVIIQSIQLSTAVAASLGNAEVASARAVMLTISARVPLQRGDRLTVEWYRVNADENVEPSATGTLTHLSVKQDLAQ